MKGNVSRNSVEKKKKKDNPSFLDALLDKLHTCWQTWAQHACKEVITWAFLSGQFTNEEMLMFPIEKIFPQKEWKKKQTQVCTVAVYDLNMIYFILLNGRINYSDTHDFKLLAISSPLLHCIHLSFLTFFESFNLSNLEKKIIFTGQTISYFQNFHSW